MTFTPGDTVFAILSFEGPDQYSMAGGLGTRSHHLARALAGLGFQTHLFFVGDPELPGEEVDGNLTLHRWCQWISRHHPLGVYDGEEGKINDWNASLPPYVVGGLVAPAAAAGRRVVLLVEEWQSATTATLIDAALTRRGLRRHAVMLWNANNLFSFERVDFASLQRAAALTTVSRYMKIRMWNWGLNPIVIPNGIPAAILARVPPALAAAVRRAAGTELACLKIGRFDPDKRWLMAVNALGLVRARGRSVKLLMRGAKEPHGADVLAQAAALGLRVRDTASPRTPADLVALLRANPDADVLNLVSFLPDEMLPLLYAASDAVLANSGHEPFGLVGLEVMAAGGLAVTGSTGEDYARAFHNAIVLETDDHNELVEALLEVGDRPGWARELRRQGRLTAAEYTWERVIDQLLHWVGLAASRQGTVAAGTSARAERSIATGPRSSNRGGGTPDRRNPEEAP